MTEGANSFLLPEPERDAIWELFHENSKITRFESGISDEGVIAVMKELCESLPFDEFPEVILPNENLQLDASLLHTILARRSGREMRREQISADQLSLLLRCAYGITVSNDNGEYVRPFRCVPSAGALFPLEIYLVISAVDPLPVGIYHYSVERHSLRRLESGDHSEALGNCFVQPEFAVNSSVAVLIAACFARSTFKYRDRGYRFTLLEAGHAAQNLDLVATAMGLSIVNIGGFYDHDLDKLLNLDGISQSVIYATVIGAHVGE